MNEETEFWKEYNQEQKRNRQRRAQRAFEQLQELCNERDPALELQKIKEWHFRVTGSQGRLDIFPQRRRWHWLPENRRGLYKSEKNLLLRFFPGE